MNVVRYSNRFAIAYTLAERVCPILLIWSVGALLILQAPGAFTYGKLLSFVSYLSMLQGPMESFSMCFSGGREA